MTVTPYSLTSLSTNRTPGAVRAQLLQIFAEDFLHLEFQQRPLQALRAATEPGKLLLDGTVLHADGNRVEGEVAPAPEKTLGMGHWTLSSLVHQRCFSRCEPM